MCGVCVCVWVCVCVCVCVCVRVCVWSNLCAYICTVVSVYVFCLCMSIIAVPCALVDHSGPATVAADCMAVVHQSLCVVLCVVVALIGTHMVSQAHADMLSFLVVGDWGGQDTAPYTRVGEVAASVGMAEVAENMTARFVLALGDNFYYSGI